MRNINPADGKAVRLFSQLQSEVKKLYIGADSTIELLFIALLAGGHVLLEGVPGIAKTTLVKTFAQTWGWKFSSCIPHI